MSFWTEDDWYLNYTVKERNSYNYYYHPEKYDYYTEYLNEMKRNRDIDKIKKSYMENHTREVSYRTISRIDTVYVYCGMMIMDSNGVPILALISQSKSAIKFNSSTSNLNSRNYIEGYSDVPMSNIKLKDADIINLLGQISNTDLGFFNNKPADFTEEEWGAFVYGRLTTILKEHINERA